MYSTALVFLGCAVFVGCGGVVVYRGVCIPPSSCHTWTTSALFCDAGIRRGLFVRRCRFVPPLLLLPQEFVMGSLLGMADRPRSRGFRPAPCNWGTTECCVARRCHGIICGRVDVPVGYLVL